MSRDGTVTDTASPTAALAADSSVAPSRATHLTLLATGSLAPMVGAAIAPALPLIHAEFASTPDADFLVRLLLTMPGLAIGCVAPFAGYALDRYDKRRILFLAVAAFVVSGSSGMFLDSLTGLLISRAALGVAAGAVSCCVTALAADLFDAAGRATFLGRSNSTNSVVGMTYVLCGGILADISWRAAFLIYVAATPLLLFLWRYLPQQPAHATSPGDAATDARAPVPWGTMTLLCVKALFCSSCFYIVLTQSPFLITAVQGGSATLSGIAIGLFTIAAFPFSFTYGRVRKKLSPWLIFAVAYAPIGVGFIMQSYADSPIDIIIAMMVTGTGFGFLVPNISTTLLGIAPLHIRGRATGAIIACFFFGQFLSPVLNQPLVRHYGMSQSLLIVGGVLLAASLVMLVVHRRLTRA